MANKKVVRKVKKKNPNLRLVKNNDSRPEKSKRGQEEKLRFGRGKRILILSAILIVCGNCIGYALAVFLYVLFIYRSSVEPFIVKRILDTGEKNVTIRCVFGRRTDYAGKMISDNGK